MSGIIGGAGSKSGVIGTTELDYEEGTWTPTTGADNETVNKAKYIKIGNQVTISLDFMITTQGSGSGTTISGLPFANPSDNMSYPVNIAYFYSLATSIISIVGQIGNNGSIMTFNDRPDAGTTMNTGRYFFGNGARVIGTGTYFIST